MQNIVLDTNVVLDRPFESILESFTEPTRVLIPLVVLDETDTFKKGFEIKNVYTRAFHNFLDELRKKGPLHEGVECGKHIIEVQVNEADLDLNKPDYKIIKAAKENNAILITQDIHERIIADALGVACTHFAPNDVDVNKLYTGHRTIDITDEEYVSLASHRVDGIPVGNRRLVQNQFITMKASDGRTFEGIYKADKKLIEVLGRIRYEAFGVRPKVDKKGEVIAEQKHLLHLLLDPSIEFVSAIGPSGCGKTLLTLAAALEQVERTGKYKKITVMRPLIPAGEDIGFLPGDKLEKLEPWMASTFDALEYLLADYDSEDGSYHEGVKEKIYGLISAGKLDLEAMAYVRGRSIPNQFIIVDDAQNLTPDQAATIITRAGEGTKLVFLGDLSEKQIDNHRLTSSSNGLAYAIDRMKGDEIVGHITLSTVVRSRLAQLGVEKL
jgi:PhoH-like ATPase